MTVTRTIIYQGWRCTYDQTRPSKERWQGTHAGEVLTAKTDAALKKLIDAYHQEQSQLAVLA